MDAKEPLTAFGREMRRRREAKYLSQPQVAEMTGLSLATISQLETGVRGSRPRRKTVKLIALALGWEVQEALSLAGYFQTPNEPFVAAKRYCFECGRESKLHWRYCPGCGTGLIETA